MDPAGAGHVVEKELRDLLKGVSTAHEEVTALFQAEDLLHSRIQDERDALDKAALGKGLVNRGDAVHPRYAAPEPPSHAEIKALMRMQSRIVGSERGEAAADTDVLLEEQLLQARADVAALKQQRQDLARAIHAAKQWTGEGAGLASSALLPAHSGSQWREARERLSREAGEARGRADAARVSHLAEASAHDQTVRLAKAAAAELARERDELELQRRASEAALRDATDRKGVLLTKIRVLRHSARQLAGPAAPAKQGGS